MERKFVIAGALCLLAGCKNQAPYKDLSRVDGAHLGYVAAFVDLLSAGAKADAEGAQRLGADFARGKLAARGKAVGDTPADAKTTPETIAVHARLKALEGDCAAPASDDTDAKKKAVTSCSAAVDKLRAALDAARAAATKEGVTDVPMLDAAHASAEGTNDAKPMVEALQPSPEEQKLAQLWDDPKASETDLTQACKKLSAVHGWRSKSDSAVAVSDDSDSVRWTTALMMLKEPIIRFEVKDDPAKLAKLERLYRPAQECVVYSTMSTYVKNGDECRVQPNGDRCKLGCMLVKGEAGADLKLSMQAYGPKAMVARVQPLWDACKDQK